MARPLLQCLSIASRPVALNRKDLSAVAISSADVVFAEVIESGFDLPHVHNYDVQSAVFVMDRLVVVTGRPRYEEVARKARSWFDGRNPAGAAVFDRAAGRVADGNINAGLALLLISPPPRPPR
jgi:hypothetical protein